MTTKLNYGAVTVLLAVLSFISVGAGTIWTASSCVSLVSVNIAANQAAIRDHEIRIRGIETDMNCVVTDVGWIRKTMESQEMVSK